MIKNREIVKIPEIGTIHKTSAHKKRAILVITPRLPALSRAKPASFRSPNLQCRRSFGPSIYLLEAFADLSDLTCLDQPQIRPIAPHRPLNFRRPTSEPKTTQIAIVTICPARDLRSPSSDKHRTRQWPANALDAAPYESSSKPLRRERCDWSQWLGVGVDRRRLSHAEGFGVLGWR
jgi:hypothetical protein